MNNMNDKQHKERPFLKLIHGGVSNNLNAEASWHSVPHTSTSQTAQADRLRHVILRLVLEELGQTVDETLREICARFDEEGEDQYARCVLIRHQLDRRGLRFMAAVDHMNLDSEGYLMLVDAKRLLARHPELAALRPEEHDLLTIGELPQSLRMADFSVSGSTIRNLHSHKPEQPKLVIPVRSYFDVPGNSRWSQESNLLRHSILALRLHDRISVREVLHELCTLLRPNTAGQHGRRAELRHGLESIGLKFEEAKEREGFPVAGYILLAWPDRLLRAYPELAGLHPAAWPALRIA